MKSKHKPQPSKHGWKLFNLISLAVTASLLLIVVVGNRGVDGLLARWGSLHSNWTLLAVGCMGIYWLLEGAVLHLLTGCLYRGVPFRSSMRTAMIGQLYSALTPFASGGQPVQLIYMQRDGLDTGGGASVLTLKSIAYQLCVMLFALAAVINSYAMFRERIAAFGWLAIIGFTINLIVTGGMLLVSISPRITSKMIRGVMKILRSLRIVRDVEGVREKVLTQVDIFHESTLRFEKKKWALLLANVLTLIQLLAIYMVPYMIYRAFGYQDAGIVHILSAVAFVSMASAFVPLPGGSGGAEGSFVLLFSLFFVSEDLLVALLLWRFITYYLCMVVGAIVMMVSRKRQRACIRLPL